MSELRREGQRGELSSRKMLSPRSHSPGSIRQITNHIPGFRLALDPESQPHQEHKAQNVQEGMAWAEREGIGSSLNPCSSDLKWTKRCLLSSRVSLPRAGKPQLLLFQIILSL